MVLKISLGRSVNGSAIRTWEEKMFDEIKNEIKDEIHEEIEKEFQKDWEKEKKKNPCCDADSWWEERRLGMKIFLGFLMGVGAVGLIFLFGWVVMLLWNWLMPEIFGLQEISYWQGWGLLILCSILFKDFPSGGGSDSGKGGDRRRKKELRKLMDESEVYPEESAPSEEN